MLCSSKLQFFFYKLQLSYQKLPWFHDWFLVLGRVSPAWGAARAALVSPGTGCALWQHQTRCPAATEESVWAAGAVNHCFEFSFPHRHVLPRSEMKPRKTLQCCLRFMETSCQLIRCRDWELAGLGSAKWTQLWRTWRWLSSHSALKERVNVGKTFASAEEGSRKGGEAMLEGKELPLHLPLQKAVLGGMSLFSLWNCYGCGAAFTHPGASHLCLCLQATALGNSLLCLC